MQEVKSKLDTLTTRQRYEIIALLFVGLCVVLALIFTLKAFTGGKYTTDTVRSLHEANTQLQRNNEKLIETVQSLNTTITDRTRRDSVLADLVEENNRLIPGINNRLNTIDRQYEKSINAARSYTASDVQSYIAAEADRLRRMQ